MSSPEYYTISSESESNYSSSSCTIDISYTDNEDQSDDWCVEDVSADEEQLVSMQAENEIDEDEDEDENSLSDFFSNSLNEDTIDNYEMELSDNHVDSAESDSTDSFFASGTNDNDGDDPSRADEDLHIFAEGMDNSSPNVSNRSNENLSTNLECTICLNSSIPNDPVITKCGHIYCKKCIGRALKLKKECPKCRKPLLFRDVNRVYL